MGFIKKIQNSTRNLARIQNPPYIYIAITNPKSLICSTTAYASLTAPYPHRSTLKLSFSLSSILTVTAAASLKPSLSQSHNLNHPHGHRPPQALILTHPHNLTLTQPLLLHAFSRPPRC